VVLLPAAMRVSEALYQPGHLRANVADTETLVATNERLIDAMGEDEVLATRVAKSHFNLLDDLLPPGEVVVVDAGASTEAAKLISIRRHPHPVKPASWFLKAGTRLEHPPIRRGLLLLAICAALGGAGLSVAPDKR
jgi:hypothetical protein